MKGQRLGLSADVSPVGKYAKRQGVMGAVVVRPVRVVSVAYTRFEMTLMTAHGYRSNPEKVAVCEFFDLGAKRQYEASDSDELECIAFGTCLDCISCCMTSDLVLGMKPRLLEHQCSLLSVNVCHTVNITLDCRRSISGVVSRVPDDGSWRKVGDLYIMGSPRTGPKDSRHLEYE